MKKWPDFISLFKTTVLLVFVLVIGCGSPNILARPGTPENYNHFLNSTVVLVEYSSGGSVIGPLCTGFFISPRRLATAEHCVRDNGIVVETSPNEGIRIRPENPEPSLGRIINFIDYQTEEDWLAEGAPAHSNILTHSATVVIVDNENDVVVLELTPSERNWETWLSLRNTVNEPVLVGERVYSISNPVGQTFILSEGIISRIRTAGTSSRILHQVRIGPGSSGSALLDKNGNVIGINVSITRDGYVTLAIPVWYLQEQLRILDSGRTVDENEE